MTPCQIKMNLAYAMDKAQMFKDCYTEAAIEGTKRAYERHLQECPVCNPEGTRKRVTDLALRPPERHRNEFVGK